MKLVKNVLVQTCVNAEQVQTFGQILKGENCQSNGRQPNAERQPADDFSDLDSRKCGVVLSLIVSDHDEDRDSC